MHPTAHAGKPRLPGATGFGLTTALPALPALLLALAWAPAQASDALARKNGCAGCHAVASQLVGPAYKAVAERYAGQPDAVAQLVAKVRKGGAGNWGDMPMPAQSGLSEADAKTLVTWILKTPK